MMWMTCMPRQQNIVFNDTQQATWKVFYFLLRLIIQMTCLPCQQNKCHIMCWRGLNKFNNACYVSWKAFYFPLRLIKQMTCLPCQQNKCHIICWRGLNKFNDACYVSWKAVMTTPSNQASCKPVFSQRLA